MFRNHLRYKRKYERIQEQFWATFERQFQVDADTRRKLDEELAQRRSQMAFALAEYRRAVRIGKDAAFEAARAYRTKFGAWPDSDNFDRKRRRRGPDDGSEMAPVMPRPKPTPLMDGAEAPIE